MAQDYDAILFDLGNVVLRIHFARCFEHWARVANRDPREISETFVHDEAYAAHEVASINGSQYHEHVCQLLKIDIPFAEFVLGWNSIFGDPIPETITLIQELKPKYKIFAFTNSNELHRPVWEQRYRSELALFDRVFCSSQLKLRKPNAEAFAKICAETGVPKQRIVFIDDTEVNVLGGRTFGFNSVFFADPMVSTNQIRSFVMGL